MRSRVNGEGQGYRSRARLRVKGKEGVRVKGEGSSNQKKFCFVLLACVAGVFSRVKGNCRKQ